MPIFGFVPLSQSLPYWPRDLFDQPEFLDLIGVRDFEITEGNEEFSISGTLLWYREISFGIPGLSGFQVVFMGEDEHTAIPFAVDVAPEFVFRFPELNVTFRFSTDLLKPVGREGDRWVVVRTSGDAIAPVDLRFAGVGIEGDMDGNFEILMPSGAPTVGMGPIQIGDTGVVLEVDRIAPYFSSRQTLPEGFPPEFRGVAIESVVFHLPEDINVSIAPADIELEHLLIGTGGFSGTIRGNWTPGFNASAQQYTGSGAGSLFGLPFALRSIDLTFMQNVPTASTLQSELYLGFLKKRLGIDLTINIDGKFSIALSRVQPEGALTGESDNQGLLTLRQEGLFSITLDSLGCEVTEELFLLVASGRLRPLLGGMDWPKFALRKLSFDSNGQVNIEGGWIDLLEQVTLDFHGFKIDISEFGIGTEGEDEERRQWLGVSGAISLVEGIPLTASVDGLKFTWDPDDPSDLDVSLRGIGLRLEIPNTLLLEGAVSYKKLGESEGGPTGLTGDLFVGHARLDLYALRTEIAAELMIGRVTDTNTGQSFTAFFIVLAAELPTALPVGATGAAIYALKGLFGMHAAPNRQLLDGEMEPWYRWYKENRCSVERDCEYTVTPVAKWQPQFDHYAFGAGLTLGTQFDDGFSLNAGALVAILIPGPVIMIEGRANLLKQRGDSGRGAEGAFYALAVFDGIASTFQLNVDIQYNLESVIEVGGGLEAFFNFNDSNNWHIYIGQKDPQDKRIRAKVLSIITANSYLMIEPTGIQTGAWVGVSFDESYGPVRLVLKAFIAFDAGIWWKEPQFEGRIQLYAEVAIKIFGIGLGLILDAVLAGRAPQPYWIYGRARVAFSLPWPLPAFDVTVEFEWGQEGRPYSIEYLKRADLIHHKLIGKSWQMSESEATAPVVPVDATPALSFAKPLYGLSVRKAEDGSDERYFKDQVDEWEFTYYPPSTELHVKEEDETWTLLKQSPLRVGDITTVTPFDVRSENLLSDVYAQEPQLLLWRYGPLHTANRPAREDYEPYCPTQQSAPLICFDWSGVSSGTVYPLEFRHAGVAFALPVAAQHAPAQVRGSLLNTPTFSMLLPEPVHYLEIRYSVQMHPDLRRQIYVRGQAYAQGKHVRELMPEPIGPAEARLFLPYSFNWNVDTIRVEIWSGSGSPGGGEVVVASGEVVIPGEYRDARIDIINVCYRTAADLQRQELTDPVRVDDSGDFLSRGLQLEPNRTYRLTVETARTEEQEASTDSITRHEPKTYYFRTGDVPGTTYASDAPDFVGTPLNDLATYVAQTIPNHGARTHYYGYDLALTFNEAYARGFYQDIHIGLRDRNGKSLGEPLSGEFASQLPLLSNGLLTYLLGQEAHPCDVAPNPPVHRRQYVYRSTNDLLAPHRMYHVEVLAPADTGDTVLYTFQFTTSRFATAEEHLTSGLREGGQIVHTLPTGPPLAMARVTERTDRERTMLAARDELRAIVGSDGLAALEIAAALDKLETATTELELLDNEVFEQIDAGVQPRFDALNMDQRNLPSVLEFIRIPIAESERSFLLLESPEPLDWRRLTIRLDEQDVQVIWNRDQTRAYICLQSGEGFERGTYTLQFHYSGGGPERPDLAPITQNGEVVSEDDISFTIEL